MTPPSRNLTPEYASIVELKTPTANRSSNEEKEGKAGPSVSGANGGVSYLRMFESFLQDRKKQAVSMASLANSSLSLNSGNFLFGGGGGSGNGGRRGRSGLKRSCETQTTTTAAECELTASRMLHASSKLTPAVMNTSGLLSVNINMDDEAAADNTSITAAVLPQPPPPPHSSSSSASTGSAHASSASDDDATEAVVSSSSSSSSSNCSDRSVESAQITPNEIEEPKRIRQRLLKYLVEVR